MTTVSSRNETPAVVHCAAPGCDTPIVAAATGRPARYCSGACRSRAHRTRPPSVPAIAEADMGSASSRGRHPDHAWLVRLRRGNKHVIIAIGLRRDAAHHLADKINQLLTTNE